jgi:hypothetical protein
MQTPLNPFHHAWEDLDQQKTNIFGDGVSTQNAKRACRLFHVLMGELARTFQRECFAFFFDENFCPLLTLPVAVLVHRLLDRMGMLDLPTIMPVDSMEIWLTKVRVGCLRRLQDNPTVNVQNLRSVFPTRITVCMRTLENWILAEHTRTTAKGGGVASEQGSSQLTSLRVALPHQTPRATNSTLIEQTAVQTHKILPI